MSQGKLGVRMTPLQQYQKDLQRPDFYEDPSQKHAVECLEDLYHRLVARANTPAEKPGFLKSLLGKKEEKRPPEKGLYFWGGVGRGKTYLVDTFFESLPFDKKLRMHFHRFMHRVHQELRLLDGEQDPLQKIADKLASETYILCFDEFFVSDITDAMILGTLMEACLTGGFAWWRHPTLCRMSFTGMGCNERDFCLRLRLSTSIVMWSMLMPVPTTACARLSRQKSTITPSMRWPIPTLKRISISSPLSPVLRAMI